MTIHQVNIAKSRWWTHTGALSQKGQQLSSEVIGKEGHRRDNN